MDNGEWYAMVSLSKRTGNQTFDELEKDLFPKTIDKCDIIKKSNYIRIYELKEREERETTDTAIYYNQNDDYYFYCRFQNSIEEKTIVDILIRISN